MVSKADAAGGGASRVAQQLAESFIAAGHEVDHWLRWNGMSLKGYARYLYGSYPQTRRLIRVAQTVFKWLGFPEVFPFEYFVMKWGGRLGSYDVVHFHDLSSAISPYTVRWVAQRLPTVWTFHDCSPFTGGCLYPRECTAYRTGCRDCPQLGKWPLDTGVDHTGLLQGIKRKTALQGRFFPVTPSQWMADMAMTSSFFREPPLVVENGVDTAIFAPGDRTAVRKRMGLPVGRNVALLSSGVILDERKGARYAMDALRLLGQERPFLLLMGNVDDATRRAVADLEFKECGYVADDTLKAEVYSAADVFLFPSLADNMPLAILESMACGTPVVGFHSGGIPEVVQHDITGYLAAPRDVGGLARGICKALSETYRQCWRYAARENIVAHFTLRRTTERYLEVYREAVKRWRVK